MMGRKFEEGDWCRVYCSAKGIPLTGLSNLSIAVMYGNLSSGWLSETFRLALLTEEELFA